MHVIQTYFIQDLEMSRIHSLVKRFPVLDKVVLLFVFFLSFIQEGRSCLKPLMGPLTLAREREREKVYVQIGDLASILLAGPRTR